MRRFVQFCGCLALMTVCTACQFFLKKEGQVRVSTSGSGGVVGIGFIENRDIRFTPHAAGNFRNMLEFELTRSGYRIQHLDYSTLKEKRNVSASKKQVAERKDPSRNLLPSHLRNVAGETGGSYLPQVRPSERPLNPREIKSIAAANGLRYLVQGAVGRSESGPLLETQEATLVFLGIYNAEGIKIGLINFTVQGRDLAEAPFLRSVCGRIAQAFGRAVAGNSTGGGRPAGEKDL